MDRSFPSGCILIAIEHTVDISAFIFKFSIFVIIVSKDRQLNHQQSVD